MRRTQAWLGWLLAMAPLAGCLNLDQSEQIKDLRVLGVRLDPPEILFSFMHLVPADQRGDFPLGPYGLSAEVLAVDPQGREIQIATRICPDSTPAQCNSYRIRDTAPPEEVRAVTPLVQPVQATARAQLALGGEVPIPLSKYTFVDRAVDYMLPHDENGQVSFLAYAFPANPSLFVRVRTADGAEEETAFKRFQLSTDISVTGIPPEIRESLQELFSQLLGAGFCPPGTDPAADVQCLKDRVANRNPTLGRLLYKVGTYLERTDDPTDLTAGGQLKDFPARLVVKPGDEVRLRPTVGEGDREPYQGLNYDFDSQSISLENYNEDMAYIWYTTVGSITSATAEVASPNPDATYSVSPDAPDGPAHVWLLVHDQRGGMDWRRLDFEVKTPPPESKPWWEELGIEIN